jgi:phosphoribosyl 1,2-cyclic phosphodiesterase
VAVLAKKYKLPVYITPLTMLHGGLTLEPHLVIDFMAEAPVTIGKLLVTPFFKLHDAAHPHSFTVAYSGVKVGVFTDLGAVCENLVQHFQQCHAAFLEANYDEEMLERGRYPYHLKRRIRGGKGHLSNKQALALFMDYKPAYMSHLFLSHLSKDNNDPTLVYNLFSTHANGTEVVVASRYQESALYHISGSAANAQAPLVNLQTSLF